MEKTTRELAGATGLSQKQIQRSLQRLKSTAQVRVSHLAHLLPQYGGWRNQRFIYIAEQD